MASKVPKGFISRSTELVKLAAKVGSEELLAVADPKAKHIHQAKALVDSLSRLKGAAMKVGQLISMDFVDVFPPEVKAILEELQASSPHFMDYEEVLKILEREIPDRCHEIKSLSREPLAAASIGQVHSASWKGQKIVLKIQYPGVGSSLESDLTLLRGALQGLVLISRKRMNLEPLFSELREVFQRETDYLLELENLLKYSRIATQVPGIRCPRVYPEISTRHLLAMSQEGGIPLNLWIRAKPSFDRRVAIGRRLLDIYCREFFENGFVQSDPNPANFLVADRDELVLLDFGAMKRFSNEFIDGYRQLMISVLQNDPSRCCKQAEAMGFLDKRETEATKLLFYEMLSSSLCAFRTQYQPFDANRKDYVKGIQEATRNFGLASEYSPPPYDLIFLHRKLLGVFGLIRDLGLKLDLTPYWKRAVGNS